MFAERYEYYYRVSKNLLTLMLSGRDIRIESTLQGWVNSYFFDLFFGIGFVNVKNMSINGVSFTENDLVDLITIMGLPMTCFLLIAFILPIYTFFGRKNFSASIAVTCILSLSFISGHVFYNLDITRVFNFDHQTSKDPTVKNEISVTVVTDSPLWSMGSGRGAPSMFLTIKQYSLIENVNLTIITSEEREAYKDINYNKFYRIPDRKKLQNINSSFLRYILKYPYWIGNICVVLSC